MSKDDLLALAEVWERRAAEESTIAYFGLEAKAQQAALVAHAVSTSVNLRSLAEQQKDR